MFQLLQPIWLFALAGVSIPVILHLWNRKPGKTLKVGSVALVEENILSYKKTIKLSELLLLLLRCFLLACIAVALARPVWRSPAGNRSKGWVLVPKQQLAQTYHHFKPLIDSLLKTGMEFHYFEEGFKKDNLENALHQTDTNNIRQLSYRGASAMLNEQVDSKLPLYIFTDNYLRNFTGNRNTVSLNIHWFFYTPDPNSVKPVADTSALRVTIFTHRYANDAHYLKAAMDAIQQFSKRNIIIRTTPVVAAIQAGQDWLFWLDDEPPTGTKNTKNILLYATGKMVKRASYILPADKQSFTAVSLYKSIPANDSLQIFDVRWQDGFGHPILSVKEQDNNSTWYYLYTHFDPSWNELTWSEDFPAVLYKLLFTKSKVSTERRDDTIIDSSQATPVVATEKAAGYKHVMFTETKLEDVCWVITFLLFFAERSLSFYYRKASANG